MTIESFKQQQQMLQDMLNSGPQMWALYLNDMRSSKIEYTTLIAVFDTPELGQAYIDAQRLPDNKNISVTGEDSYRGSEWTWVHAYRPGPLWWFNPPFSYADQGVVAARPWIDYSGASENPVFVPGPFEILTGDITEESKKLLNEWKEAGRL
jgi:predicted phosphohydrolase